MWVLQHHSVHAYDISTIIIFVYLGLQIKGNQLSSNNSHHTSSIHKGWHAGKWPDPMSSKTDFVSTLRYHWTDHIGRPLDTQALGCHWNHTGWYKLPVVSQWRSNVNLHTLEHTGTPLEGHWKTTGSTMETHWLPTILSPGAFQCTLEFRFQAHCIATGMPLNYHCLRVRDVSSCLSDFIQI